LSGECTRGVANVAAVYTRCRGNELRRKQKNRESRRLCDGSDGNHVTGCDVIKMADGMLQGRVLRWSSDVGGI